MKSAKEMIKEAMNKHDSIFQPTGVIPYRFSTGSIAIDRILSGGLPAGRIVQLYGPERVGKTTLLYHIIGEAQKVGRSSVLVALENSYDRKYAIGCGIDVDGDNFEVVAADFAELSFNLIMSLIRHSDAQLIAIDSIAAASPRVNLDKKHPVNELDKGPNIGAKARSIGEFMDKTNIVLIRKEASIVFVNQLRTKIATGGYGHTVQTPAGGLALQYFTSIKLNMRRIAEDKINRSITTQLVVDKSKDYDIPIFSTCSVDITHGVGINKDKEIVTLGEELGIITKKGAWYYYKDYKWQGINNAADCLGSDDNLKLEISDKILANKDIDVVSKDKLEETDEEDEYEGEE